MDQVLRRRLLDLLEKDTRTRQQAAADGSLFQGYNEALRAVHNENAKALAEIVDAGDWPDKFQAGEDGATAAFLIVQHAIGLPNFMRACLDLMEEAAERGGVPRWQVALLTDRIRMLEGRPQVYGTQFDWTVDGKFEPLPIEEPETVDLRRTAAELVPMAQAVEVQRKENAEMGGSAPSPQAWLSRQREFEAWAKAVGWRK